MRIRTRALWHPHDRRHVAAADAVRLGACPRALSRLLGYANTAFALSRYVGVRAEVDSTNELTAGW